MAALKLSLIQKYKLENAYTYVYSTGFLSGGSVLKQGADSIEEGNAFMSHACPEQGVRALILTRKEEAPRAYSVLVLSETGIQEIELGEDFLDRENDPMLFSFGDSFGVIKAKKEIASKHFHQSSLFALCLYSVACDVPPGKFMFLCLSVFYLSVCNLCPYVLMSSTTHFVNHVLMSFCLLKTHFAPHVFQSPFLAFCLTKKVSSD